MWRDRNLLIEIELELTVFVVSDVVVSVALRMVSVILALRGMASRRGRFQGSIPHFHRASTAS